MRTRGFSLVEMICVICIISVIVAIATLVFNDMSYKNNTESQTRIIYNELMAAQAQALTQRKIIRVKLYAGRFDVYSSALDDTSGVAPIRTIALHYPIVCNGDGDGTNGYPLDFSPLGITNWTSCLNNNNCAICIDNNKGAGAVDSVAVALLKLELGKRSQNGSCDSSNITIK